MVREIVHDPMFLALKSEQATQADLQVAEDLLDTLRAHLNECVGMAANMIGVRKNIIAVSMGFTQVVMLNAEITRRSRPYQAEEACLSLTGGPRPVMRYREIEVSYQDTAFHSRKEKFTGFAAQIIQHELDHVNGVLI